MSVSVTNSIKLTMLYEDFTERTYSIPVYNTPNPTSVKENVWAFNDDASISGSDLQKTFISENGLPVMQISTAQIVTVEEEVIYSG